SSGTQIWGVPPGAHLMICDHLMVCDDLFTSAYGRTAGRRLIPRQFDNAESGKPLNVIVGRPFGGGFYNGLKVPCKRRGGPESHQCQQRGQNGDIEEPVVMLGLW